MDHSSPKKVLIFSPGIRALSQPERFTTIYDFPRGALCLGSFLDASGIETAVIPLDYYLTPSRNPEFIQEQITSVIQEALSEYSPSVIGVSVPYTMLYPASLKIIETAKRMNPSITACLGGSHVSHLDAPCFEDSPYVDVVVRGEGEWTFHEVVKNTLNGKSMDNIPGITFKKDTEIIKNPPRPLGEILDLPPLNYRLLPEEFVRNMAVSIVASRGCAFKCSFCNESRFWGNKVRMPPVSSIVAELKDLSENYGNYPVGLEDSMFNMRSDYFFDLCDNLSQLRLNPNFYILSRVDSVTPEGLEAMRKAGIKNLVLGIENASPKVLKAMNKKITIEDTEKACAEAVKQGIIVGAFWILGHPGDSPKEADITINAMDRLYGKGLIRNSEIALFVPYPGTDIFENPDQYGIEILTKEWDRWGRFNTEPVCQLKEFKADEILSSWKRAKEISDGWMGIAPQPPAPSKHQAETHIPAAEKVGRNEPCPCGSGKKYKKCCGKGVS